MSLFTLGWTGGSGSGLPFPVPVILTGVKNIAMISAKSIQISLQTVNSGITDQVAQIEMDNQAPAKQIKITTGNNCK